MREYITEVKWLTYLDKIDDNMPPFPKICYSLYKTKTNVDIGRAFKHVYAV
jgi:hypothetical protein